jgi:hypothetical protein
LICKIEHKKCAVDGIGIEEQPPYMELLSSPKNLSINNLSPAASTKPWLTIAAPSSPMEFPPMFRKRNGGT